MIIIVPLCQLCLLLQGSSGRELFLETPKSHGHTVEAGSVLVLFGGQDRH